MELEPEKAFEKGMRLIAKAMRDENVAIRLRGSPADRAKAFMDVGLTEAEARQAAREIADHYFAAET